MKLYYISNSNIPTEKAYGYAISKMCEQLAKKGAEVTLVLPGAGGAKRDDLFDKYKVERIFSVKTVPSISFRMRGRLFSRLAFFIESVSFTLSLIAFKAEKGSVLYSRDIYTLPVLALKSKNLFFELHTFTKREKFLGALLKIPKGVIVTTEHLKKRVVELGVSEKKVLVAHDAVDLSNFDIEIRRQEARKQLDLPENVPVLLYSGSFKTMGEEKGISTILEGIRELVDENPEILFVAVGGSEKDIEYYSERASRAGISKNVRFIRPVSLSRLAIYQKASDVLTLPFPFTEHYAYYMSPLKMFEYMASKRSIVASNLPSIREVLNSETAIFFNAGDSHDFAKAVSLALKDSKMSSEIAENAHKMSKNYRWEDRARKILEHIGK